MVESRFRQKPWFGKKSELGIYLTKLTICINASNKFYLIVFETSHVESLFVSSFTHSGRHRLPMLKFKCLLSGRHKADWLYRAFKLSTKIIIQMTGIKRVHMAYFSQDQTAPGRGCAFTRGIVLLISDLILHRAWRRSSAALRFSISFSHSHNYLTLVLQRSASFDIREWKHRYREPGSPIARVNGHWFSAMAVLSRFMSMAHYLGF